MKSIFAVIFCVLGIVFIIVGGLAINLCHFQYQFYNDTTFYKSVQPNETNFQKFLTACAYSTSSMLITDYLDTTQAQAFNDLTKTHEGLDNYGTYKTTYYDTNKTTPTSISSYYSTLATYADFSADDFTNAASAHKPSTV